MPKFRYIIYASLLTIASIQCAIGQQALPPAYPSGSQVNYIRTWQSKAPFTDPAAVKAAGPREVKTTTIYIDGLGREIQSVIKKGSLLTGDTARDLVSGKVYDSEGRVAVEYLPFSASNTGGNSSISDGGFKRNPFQQQTAYFNTRLAGQSGETNVGANSLTWAYSHTVFDGSPMDRVTKTLPAGKSWVGSGRGVSTNYWVNTAADNVRMWKVTEVPGNWPTYTTPSAYPAGSLLKNVSTDEEGKQLITFTDKAGHLILSKKQGTAPADNGTGTDNTSLFNSWQSTYYVYDDLDNLRLLITPQGSEMAKRHNWDLYLAWTNGVVLDELCYQYVYNGRHQVIRSKAPGAAEVLSVYDARGRVVLQQDGNLRNGTPVKWKYTTYDSLNRVLSTGLWNTTTSWATLLTAGETANSYPTLTSGTYEELTFKRYDTYGGLPAGFSATYDATGVNASSIVTTYGTSPEYAEQLIQTTNPDSKLTWEAEKIMGTSQFLYRVYYYDEKSRVIQERYSNASGSISSLTRQFNFAGQIIRTFKQHQKGGTNPASHTVFTKTTYDELGRETYYGQKTGAGDAYKTHATFGYDHLGKLKTKSIGIHPSTLQPLETQEYAYNVRGWLLGVNQPFAFDTADQSRWFGYQLSYDADGPTLYVAPNPLEQKRYNGGVSRVLWKSAGDQKIRKYELNYDAYNQLVTANFYQYKGSNFTQNELNFTMSNVMYDYNGNLMQMVQYGWKPSGNTVIDALNYQYHNNFGNRLRTVTEGYEDTTTMLGDFRTSSTYLAELGVVGYKSATVVDYTYDFNGNQTKDRNKDIDTIFYNSLNLPYQANVRGKGTITYTYSATGIKLEKAVVDSTQSPVLITTTKYFDNFVYESVQHGVAQPQDYIDKPLFFTSKEGRTRFMGGGTFKDDYLIKDHLGNVRMVLSDEIGIDAYPTLSLEGTVGSAEITQQNTYWENKTGASINVAAVRTARPGGFGDTTANGHQVLLLRKSTGSIGAAKMLKVMKGDRLHAYVEYYFQTANANNTGASGITTLIANLASALSGGSSIADFLKPGASTIASALSGNAPLTILLNTPANTSGGNSAPKAYMNVLFFDERMIPDVDASRSFPVAYTPNMKATIDKRLANALTAQRNGYVYAYISNESDEFVHFDNFMLSHEHSPLLEETHYYPFGLPIAPISPKTIGKIPNKYAYNGMELQAKEFGPKHGLQWHDFGARMYDHQIGRWLSPDPNKSSYEWISPYAYGFNNPMQVADPTGRDGVVTGSGSQTDPYVVTANYYYYNMTDEQAAAFRASIDAYNNDGKAHAVKVDGGTVYVKFQLGAEKAENRSDALAKSNNDVVKRGTMQYNYGNTVTVGSVEGAGTEDALGAATNRTIILDENRMQALVEQRPGVDINKLRTGVGIHEIGHNLGGVHNEPGNIMVDTDVKGVTNPNKPVNSGPDEYRLYVSYVDNGGLRAIAGRFGTEPGSVESRYISAKERRRITETRRNGNVVPVTQQEINDK